MFKKHTIKLGIDVGDLYRSPHHEVLASDPSAKTPDRISIDECVTI